MTSPRKTTDLLASRQIDLAGLERVPGGKTFFWAGVYSADMNDRTTLRTDLNVFAGFDPKLPASYRTSPYLLLGNIQPELQKSVRAQMNGVRLTGGDTMNYWINDFRPQLLDTLKEWDFLLINDSEARQLSGVHNLRRAAAKIMEMGPSILVIKRGEYGAVLFHRGRHFMVPGYLLEDVFDPTGAGDSFAGGFIGYLAGQGVTPSDGNIEFEDLRRAVIYGSVMGSFCCEKVRRGPLPHAHPRGNRGRAIRNSKTAPRSSDCFWVAAALAALSAAAVWFFYSHGWLQWYGDAEAHLNNARRIFDSQRPGYDQLGSPWLPLPHVLMLPFVRVDSLWYSGLAAAFPSAAFFVMGGVFLFAAARRIFESNAAALAATALATLNPNLLYLQSTSMTEAIFFGCFMALLYCTVRNWAALAGVAALLCTLTRYEGWFVLPFVALYFLRRGLRPGDCLLADRRRGPALLAVSQLVSHQRRAVLLPRRGVGEGDSGRSHLRGQRQLARGVLLLPARGTALCRAGAGRDGARGHGRGVRAARVLADAAARAAGRFLRLERPLVRSADPHAAPLAPRALQHPLRPRGAAAAGVRCGRTGRVDARACAGSGGGCDDSRAGSLVACPAASDRWITWAESRANSEGRRGWTDEAAEFLSRRYVRGSGILTTWGDLAAIYRKMGIPLHETFNVCDGLPFEATLRRPDLHLHEEWGGGDGRRPRRPCAYALQPNPAYFMNWRSRSRGRMNGS